MYEAVQFDGATFKLIERMVVALEQIASKLVESAPSASTNIQKPCASQIADRLNSLCTQLSDKLTLAQYDDLTKCIRQLRIL